MTAIAAIVVVTVPAGGQTILGTADNTAGVYLFSAGSSSGTCQSPTGQPAAQPTDDIVSAAITFNLLEYVGDHTAEIDAFTAGTPEGDPGVDNTIAEVRQGLEAIDDFGVIGGNSDDSANFDAGTGGSVTCSLNAISGGSDDRVIRADGVVATGTIGPAGAGNAGAAAAALGGFEIFLLDDAELSGMTIRLTSPTNDISIVVTDRQVNPHTQSGGDDTLIAIDLDTLPGFDGTFIQTIQVTDDGVVMSDSPCPRQGETSLELDAIAVRFSATATLIDVTATANPTSRSAPGGPVTFTVRADNDSTVDDVTINTLSSNLHGNLNGMGNCSIPQVIPAGSFYQCSYVGNVAGAAGATVTNSISASGIDDDGDPVSGADGAAVIITGLTLSKDALPVQVTAPGGNVTFSAQVNNPSAIAVTVTGLVDNVHGNLNGQGTCSVPQVVGAGGSYSCSFVAFVAGAGGGSEVDTIVASGTDAHGNAVSAQDSATVNIVGPPATSTNTPTTTRTPTPTTTSTPTRTPTHTSTTTPTSTGTTTSTGTPTNTPTPFCGDGVLGAGEDCDDGNGYAGDGCENDCTISVGCEFSHGVVPQERFVGACGAPSHPDIQSAVDASGDGDVVTVCPGTYTSPVAITTEITLRSSGGPAVTTVHTAGTTIDVQRSGVRIEGLTLRSDTASAISANAICPLTESSCGAPGGSNVIVIGNVIEQSDIGVGWTSRVDCVEIANNSMTANATHIAIEQASGDPAILVLVENNTLLGGGQSGASVRVSGIRGTIAANRVLASATNGVVLGAMAAGSKLVENDIRDNPGDGVRILPGAEVVRVENNNIEDNGVGLANEATAGVLDATLNWWGSQTGPSGLYTGLGDLIVERGTAGTTFIEYLCRPFPEGFPSTLGVCTVETAELRQLLPGRSPDLAFFGRFISFESSANLHVDSRGVADNSDGSQETFLIDRRPRPKFGGVCLGGLTPCDFGNVSSCPVCEGNFECPGDPSADPIILNGDCVMVTQLSDGDPGALSASPRISGRGNVVMFVSDADQTGDNPDGSMEVYGFDGKTYQKTGAGVSVFSDAQPPFAYQAPSLSLSGRYLVVESSDDPTGENPDGNTEIFVIHTKKREWIQITKTTGFCVAGGGECTNDGHCGGSDTCQIIENRRPSTVDGKRVVFDSNADLHNSARANEGANNADHNREIFVAKTRKSGTEFIQVTESQAPIENRSGAGDSRASTVAFSSNGDYTAQNPTGNREIFAWHKRRGYEQITQTATGDSDNPVLGSTGRWLVFDSDADLNQNGASNRRVFLFDRDLGELTTLSRLRFGENTMPRVRRRRFVVWESNANLTGNNPNGEWVIYIFDRKKDD